MFQRRTTIVVAILAAALGGCGEVTRPLVTNVQLSLSASHDESHASGPVTLHVLAANVSGTKVWHCAGCGCGNGISVTVLGPNGRPVALEPIIGWPGCADGLAPLGPDSALRARKVFTGTLYEQNSPVFPPPSYPAPPGSYQVVARFSYRATDSWSAPPVNLVRRISFTWPPESRPQTL